MIKLYGLCLILIINISSIFPNPEYLLQVSNLEKTDDSTIEFDVYLKSQSSPFELTSYQCVFTLNPNLLSGGEISFSYIIGSSELVNIKPEAGIGTNNSDGEIKLTFASLPGSETIASSLVKVGRFKINTNGIFNNSSPDIRWCSTGKINTILTGENFSEITNSDYHLVSDYQLLKVLKVLASATTDSVTAPEKVIDGICSCDGDPDSRWAADPMPEYLVFDMGHVKTVDSTEFSFYRWDYGRVYNYSILTSTDSALWDSTILNSTSSSEEWTINLINKKARYIKLVFNSHNESGTWAGLWEAKIFGKNDTLNSEPLPIELTSFNADFITNSVQLKWNTATEINNRGFEVERNILHAEGNKENSWKKIGFVEGNGTSTEKRQYKFIDDLKYIALNTVVKYRLKQVDFDGTSAYSDEVKVNVDLMPKEFVLYQNYPNPFNPATDIKYSLPVESCVYVTVYNAVGEQIKEYNEGIKQAGYHDVIFAAANNASGVYFYTISAQSSDGKNSFRKTAKMLLLK